MSMDKIKKTHTHNAMPCVLKRNIQANGINASLKYNNNNNKKTTNKKTTNKKKIANISNEYLNLRIN